MSEDGRPGDDEDYANQDYVNQDFPAPPAVQPAQPAVAAPVTFILLPHRQRIVHYLRSQGEQWSSRDQVLRGARLDPGLYDDEIAWLQRHRVAECRRIDARKLTPAQRGFSSTPQWMVRLHPAWHPEMEAPPPTVPMAHPAPKPRARLRAPMAIQAACLSLAARVVARLRPHMPEHHCTAAATICPAVWLGYHLSVQQRARLRPLLAGLTGARARASAPPWDDEQDLGHAYAVWQDLCTLAGQLKLNPSESIDDGYAYASQIADLLSQELPAGETTYVDEVAGSAG